MIHLLNDLVVNLALITLFVLISLFSYKRLTIESPSTSIVKKYLFVTILALIACYWVTINDISFRGFTFDFSIVLLIIALYYGGTSYGIITWFILLMWQVVTLTNDEFFLFPWILITYTVILSIVLLLKHLLRDEFKTLPLIITCCLLIHLPLVYISENDMKSFMENAILFSFYIALVAVLIHSFLYYVKQHYEQVRLHQELALTDSLTGLHNRRALEDQGDYFMIAHPSFTVMMIDVDHFKFVNDKYGHDQGDAILSQISNLLGEHTPHNGVVGRYGGEEFMLLIPETNVSYVEQLAEDIRFSCATTRFLIHHEDYIHVTLSIGISSCESRTSISFMEVTKSADAALYEAKRRGRNQVFKATQTHFSAQ
ncbi:MULTISPECIES: GGDEF domain-containing protein [unclassified Exiguobacterium]|uniref:GGDEF domain-containing protein n=1 Tax=unclassified Exiguobacterium TaxID=2644629 RepID=UPI001BEB1369|nr:MULTISPECIES: GGDEF domain-containing protein [unclassified Exiguobacterium]